MPRWTPASLALGGGLLLVAGALLPWLTLYGGLHRFAGISGLYGWILLGLGVVAVSLALRDRRAARPASSAVLLGVALVSGVLAATRLSHTHALVSSGDALMLVPAIGPGLLVALLGSTLLAVSGVTRRRRR
jgi:uncharacterized membrane protein